MGGGRGFRGGEETYWVWWGNLTERSLGRVWWENLTERRSLGRPGCKWDSNIKINLNHTGVVGYLYLRLGTGITDINNFRLHKMLGIF